MAVMRNVSLHSETSRFSWEPLRLIDGPVQIDTYKKGQWDASALYWKASFSKVFLQGLESLSPGLLLIQ